MKNGPIKTRILNIGDQYEDRGHRMLIHIAVRLINGFFHFKKNKGDLVAGCATFFSLLSFCPVLLLMVSLVGQIIGDNEVAKTTVMEGLQSNFPNIAPWILTSVDKIISAQLVTSAGMNFVNMLLLLYSSLGVIGAIMFGMDTISGSSSRGGFIIQDFKALGLGAFAYLFMLGLVITSNPKVFSLVLGQNEFWGKEGLLFMSRNNILPVILSMSFFTFFYKWAPARAISLKNALWGAGAFVGSYLCGKTFYWVYLHYSKDGLASNFGDFYTMIVAVVWIYFLLSSFFYGAGVAYVKSHLKVVEDPTMSESPEIPDIDQAS